MNKTVGLIYKSIVIDEVFIARIIRRINIDEVNLTTMRLFQQFQCGKVIPFKQEIHLPTVVNKQICLFGQYWRMGIQHLIDFLPMLLEHAAAIKARICLILSSRSSRFFFEMLVLIVHPPIWFNS